MTAAATTVSRLLRYLCLSALICGPFLLIAGLIAAGRWAREELREQDRYSITFADIECPPPPGGEEPGALLAEVQYLAGLPDRLRLLDDGLAARLAEAFGRHAWVERVERVEVLPGRVRVRLAYRVPVLAVRQGGQLRAVDRHGVLLPATAATAGLPVFPGQARPPQGPAGTPWGDADVEAAARDAGR